MTKYIIEIPDEFLAGYDTKHDITPLVRCRDCTWFTPEYYWEEERGCGYTEILCEPPSCGNPERCNKHYDSSTQKMVPVHIFTEPDGFCAWGERKVDA